MGMDLIPVYEDGEAEAGEGIPIIKIRPEIINNLGVRSTKVERGRLWKRIGTVGYIDYDETRINHIHTRTEGWIEKLKVRAEGEQVKRGQLLFELYSPLLVNAQEEYLQALAIGNRLLSEASQKKLSALGISKSQIDRLKKDKKVTQNVSFYAPQSGVLTNLGVREGMYIKPETQILSIANLDTIWLLAEVFERQANWVSVGQSAEAKLPSMPSVIWKGTVEYIYPDLDPVTRTLRVRLRFDNSKGKLKPNMYSHVTIFSGEKKDVISIPREALIRDARQERVIKVLGEGRFQVQEVVAGMESGDWIEIVEGLNEGDEIVTSSQFLIDSESNLKASLNRMQVVDGPVGDQSMDDNFIEHTEMSKE
jgi:Cu(I)/Ag(I) efflux system membrane fusion protein